MENDVALLGVGDNLYGVHDASAFAGSVAGVDVNVQGAKAFGAMVAGGVSEGLYLESAVGAYEAVVVFGKKFLFHFSPVQKDAEKRPFVFEKIISGKRP